MRNSFFINEHEMFCELDSRPFGKSITFKVGRNIHATYLLGQDSDDIARTITVRAMYAVLDTDEQKYLLDYLNPDGSWSVGLHKNERVTPDYKVEGWLIPDVLTRYDYYYNLIADGQHRQGDILFWNCLNGVINRLAHELIPEMLPDEYVMPYQMNGQFHQPLVFRPTFSDGVMKVIPIAGAAPYLVSVDGSDFTEQMEYPAQEGSTYTVGIKDRLDNEFWVQYTAQVIVPEVVI